MGLRYLIILLLVIFSNTFGIDGSITVRMRAEVLDPTDLYLEVTPVTNTDDEGSKMYFDFGEIVRGSKQELIGKFQARLIRGGVAENIDNIKVSLLKSELSLEESKQNILLDQVELMYRLSGNLETENRLYSGKIRVLADTSKGVQNGSFIDNSMKIKVSISSTY